MMRAPVVIFYYIKLLLMLIFLNMYLKFLKDRSIVVKG